MQQPQNIVNCVLKYRWRHLDQLAHTRGNFNSGYFFEKNTRAIFRDPARQARYRAPKTDNIFLQCHGHRSAVTEIAFNFANSDMLPIHPTALTSVHATSFYSLI
jgi:hypothetical protein